MIERGRWEGERKRKRGRGAAYWLAPRGLFFWYFFRTQDTSSGLAPSSVGWALLQQSLIRKIPSRLASGLIMWRHFLN